MHKKTDVVIASESRDDKSVAKSIVDMRSDFRYEYARGIILR